jgi:hypothetical protein
VVTQDVVVRINKEIKRIATNLIFSQFQVNNTNLLNKTNKLLILNAIWFVALYLLANPALLATCKTLQI